MPSPILSLQPNNAKRHLNNHCACMINPVRATNQACSIPGALGCLGRHLALRNLDRPDVRGVLLYGSLALLIVWRPALVLGTGGYVIGPVMVAARVLGIRCVLQEQNAVPGSANRLASRWAERIYLGFGAAEKYFRKGTTVVTGNPVRKSFSSPVAESEVMDGFENPELADGRVLVFGGSGGAHTLNLAFFISIKLSKNNPYNL